MDTSKLYFVKGFITSDSDTIHKHPCFTGNFQAVLTDLTETVIIDVTSATKENGNWKLTGIDGETIVLADEPDNIRYVDRPTLVTNFSCDLFGNKFTRIPHKKYTEVFDAITHGNREYRLIGYVNGQKVVTGPLVNVWGNEESDELYCYHAITHSGTHYAFY